VIASSAANGLVHQQAVDGRARNLGRTGIDRHASALAERDPFARIRRKASAAACRRPRNSRTDRAVRRCAAAGRTVAPHAPVEGGSSTLRVGGQPRISEASWNSRPVGDVWQHLARWSGGVQDGDQVWSSVVLPHHTNAPSRRTTSPVDKKVDPAPPKRDRPGCPAEKPCASGQVRRDSRLDGSGWARRHSMSAVHLVSPSVPARLVQVAAVRLRSGTRVGPAALSNVFTAVEVSASRSGSEPVLLMPACDLGLGQLGEVRGQRVQGELDLAETTGHHRLRQTPSRC